MSEKIKIGLASDHGGFGLKEQLKQYIADKGYEVVDFGTHSEESVDYPQLGAAVPMAILNGEVDRGIIMCGSGIGISITANRFPGVRAALCWDHYTAKMCRLHNDANILAMGGRLITFERAVEMVDVYLETEFEGGRHQRRIDMIDEVAIEAWKKYLEGK